MEQGYRCQISALPTALGSIGSQCSHGEHTQEQAAGSAQSVATASTGAQRRGSATMLLFRSG